MRPRQKHQTGRCSGLLRLDVGTRPITSNPRAISTSSGGIDSSGGEGLEKKGRSYFVFTPNLSPDSSSSLRGVRGSGTSSTLREGLHISKGEPLGSKNGARTLEKY